MREIVIGRGADLPMLALGRETMRGHRETWQHEDVELAIKTLPSYLLLVILSISVGCGGEFSLVGGVAGDE
ncbi:hypothetical protein [Massilia pseudoviolaceinigra]|uniref:hypothetical protein n=1 Tax=Massilia pseudoviolaceinigra TaxID=3057165 RepID=UPI00279693F6|nr:hypothetical protein [Massilia sp. CCM 9206]MDQ1919186.1 hypothetical protein [Massilia sp. CCM 9206]